MKAENIATENREAFLEELIIRRELMNAIADPARVGRPERGCHELVDFSPHQATNWLVLTISHADFRIVECLDGHLD